MKARASRVAALSLFALAALAVGCSRGLLPADRVLAGDSEGAASLRALLSPGSHVALVPGAACRATEAPTLDALLRGAGTKSSFTSGGAARLLQVRQATARLRAAGERGFFAVELRGDDGGSTWVGLPMGEPQRCLAAATPRVVAASKLDGKKVVFSPWQHTCARIEARGTAASALLDAAPGAQASITGLVDVVDGEPWLGLMRGTLRVPLDVVEGCFASARESAAPPSALSLLHTHLGRCSRDDDQGKEHIECRSTVGVWDGRASPDGLSLRLVRRTLGPVHITDGGAVDGRRYARTLIAVSTGRPKAPHQRELYAAIEGAVKRALAEGDGSIRVASPSDPLVGHKLEVDAEGLTVGDLARRAEPATSEYQDGERDVDNPAYAEARRAVEVAEDALEQASRRYRQDREEHARTRETIAQAKKVCLQGCDALKKAGDRALCMTGCEGGGLIGGALNSAPSKQPVEAAQDSLRAARRALESTPRTIKEPIMRTWTYTKTTYSRTVSVSLRLALTPKGRPPRTITQRVSETWTDHEVTADPAHNVPGHEPDRAKVERPEAILPWFALGVARVVAARLPPILEDAELEDARRALSADLTKPGFEPVDAKALSMVGARLRRAVLRGRAIVSAGAGSAVPLPTESQAIAEGECLLTVAVLDEGALPAGITLSTDDGTFADLRGKRVAAVEACAGDMPSRTGALRFEIKSVSAGEVRWSVYRTVDDARRSR